MKRIGGGAGALVGAFFEALKRIVDPPTVPLGAPPALIALVTVKATPSTWLARVRAHPLTPYVLLSLIAGVVLCGLLAESVYGYRQHSGDRALFVCAGQFSP